ncbi:hypothetical protein GCM10023189_29720 [Nibrella saemangeumensis]|uniref:YdhG-like domain-containing protein n=1 Tax=Nibrella saemangeumensis TaxID=1084526 RepID=A0ABP8MZT8_9BACT
MLQTLHDDLRQQLLSIDGMTSRPYSGTGQTPKGGIEEFLLRDKYFAGLRLTEKHLMLYLMPIYTLPDLNERFAERLKPVRSGKSCLKISRPERLDREALETILTMGAARW